MTGGSARPEGVPANRVPPHSLGPRGDVKRRPRRCAISASCPLCVCHCPPKPTSDECTTHDVTGADTIEPPYSSKSDARHNEGRWSLHRFFTRGSPSQPTTTVPSSHLTWADGSATDISEHRFILTRGQTETVQKPKGAPPRSDASATPSPRLPSALPSRTAAPPKTTTTTPAGGTTNLRPSSLRGAQRSQHTSHASLKAPAALQQQRSTRAC